MASVEQEALSIYERKNSNEINQMTSIVIVKTWQQQYQGGQEDRDADYDE